MINFNNNGYGNNFGMGVMNNGFSNLNLNQQPLMNNYNQTNDNNNNIMGGNNMNQNQNNNNQQQKREPLNLTIEPVEFDGLLKTKFTTTVELAKTVNEMFRPVFSDYEGCLILPNQMGGFDTIVYFCDKGIQDERLKALRPVVQQGNLNISQRINNLNRRYQNKTYELTEDCKDIFSEFMVKERNSNKVRWNQLVVEKAENNYNSCTIHVQLNGIDIMKILKKIYGSTVKGNRTDYSMKLERGIGVVNGAGLFANYLVSILQLDTKEVERVAQSVGMVPLADTIPMVK